MKFSEIVKQAVTLLQDSGRISYRALKREFDLDDETLDDLKEELIDIREVAADKDGKMLVWTGGTDASAQASAPTASASSGQPTPPSTQPEPISLDQAGPAGERRQLTVMFCDLVGSTVLSEQLDPEDLHAVVRTYQDACRQVIERYEGYIAQYLGDGILVYFGYPAAHEDDAVRGVRAGLEILAALPTLELAQPVQARIGIHTGPVVIGTVGGGEHTEQLALGETPNIAARVQGKAEPDTVAISADTYRLVQGFFTCEDLGPQELKGLSSPLTLYQVTGEGEAQNRFDVSVQQGLTPLIGREEEVELLVRRWERAKAGEGQVVLLSGEAGIGKSRLVQVLREQIADEDHFGAVFRCSPFYQNSALYPVIDGLQKFLQLGKDDTPEAKLTKLTHALEPVQLTDPETTALVASLLSIPLPDDHPPLQLSPQKQKEKTLQVLVQWLQNVAKHQPVRVEIEDLHWADPSTLEFLGLLIDQVPSSRMLLLLTFRPEFSPPWPGHAHMLWLRLHRLPQQDIAAMVERVAGKALPEEVVQQLLTKSDGVPLYIEEMTKNLLESGLLTETNGQFEVTAPLPPLAIPSSLQDSFAARLDRLAPIRELAQIGAVLGRKFGYDLIQAVSRMDDPKLQDGLRQLSAAEILFQRGVPPDATYTFKHALLQDAAYASFLKSRRQQVHARTAQVLEQQFPENTETHPELVAHHYTEARLAEQAIPYWQQAGQRAVQRSANAEAEIHLATGIRLLKTLSDTPERAQHELSLQLALGPVLMATKSIGHADVESTYTRARELCQQLGDTPQLFPVVWGLRRFYVIRAKYKTGRELEEQLLRLAQNAQDSGLLLEAQWAWGTTSFWFGELAIARERLVNSLSLYDPQLHHSHAFQYGTDPGVSARSYNALTLWHLGYPDQALSESQRVLTLAHEVGHPLSQVYALYVTAWIHYLRREVSATQTQAEAAIRLATEHEFPYWVALGGMMRGGARAVQGESPAGIAELSQGLAAHRAIGGKIGDTLYLAMLAEAYSGSGQREAVRGVLTEALEIVDESEERAYEAKLYQLQGELCLQSQVESPRSQVKEEAEASFQKALAIARQQSAKSLELCAATSLARLWQQQGKTAEASDLLTPVYEWFTEGFDTKDLQEAKALLEAVA